MILVIRDIANIEKLPPHNLNDFMKTASDWIRKKTKLIALFLCALSQFLRDAGTQITMKNHNKISSHIYHIVNLHLLSVVGMLLDSLFIYYSYGIYIYNIYIYI